MADEKTIREVTDDLVQRVTETQAKMGLIPSATQARDFIEPIVAQQAAQEAFAPTPVSPAPERDPVFSRSLGSVTWDPNNDTFSGPALLHPKLAARAPAGKQAKLKARLEFLALIPWWRSKVLDAWFSKGSQSERADRVIAVYEESCKKFGD